MSESSSSSGFRYRAFISYSHADEVWGKWLHKALETWRMPPRLAAMHIGSRGIPRPLSPIFLDREELASATDLSRKVNEALAQSEALIVICSPRSAQSRWVNEEVLAFKRMGRDERVFCLVVDGEPNATYLPGHEAEECFCPALRYRVDAAGQLTGERIEPIAADVRPGKDGKANARLKLIAGLLDVGFDAIRHRELQRHTRRMTAIAGLGLLAAAIMGTFAGVAVHERNYALLQREQAEDLIGFMLGDLRTNLDTVGRLDLLDDVADHALRYFEAQSDPGDISSRTKRASALLLLGRVRLDQGKIDDAKRAFTESLRFSQVSAADDNHVPALQLAVVDAEFWLGTAAWQSGETQQALAYFRAALPIVTTVTNEHPNDDTALQRLAWMHTNVGHVFEVEGAWSKAMDEYAAELRVAQRLVSQRPNNRLYQVDLATAHDNIAALLYAHGRFEDAEQQYLAERAVLAKLVTGNPRDSETTSLLAVAQTYLAQVAESLGHTDSARDNLRQAKIIGETALASDPGNMTKLGDLAAYCRRLARNLRLTGNPSAAAPLLERAAALYAQMLGRAPTSARGQYGLAATRLEQAQLAWQAGDATVARRHTNDAGLAFTALLHAQNYERDASLGLANTLLLQGKLDMAVGKATHARSRWLQALDAMQVFGSDSQDPNQLDAKAEILTLLGRASDAQRLISRLDAMHYRDPAFVAWRNSGYAANAP